MTFKISVIDDTFNPYNGEDMQVRASHLYPGEIIRIACLERVDE